MKTIEYIGPKPTTAKRAPKGSWWMLMLALSVATGGSLMLSKYVQAQNSQVSASTTTETITNLHTSQSISHRLAAAALERTRQDITLDHAYYIIDYPGGDIDLKRGKEADLIVRSFRALGTDLQVLIHEDMKTNFRAYPQIYNMAMPDPNIDHRRVPNLARYFSRHGEVKKNSRQSADYAIGDIVIWRLPYGADHIGIVVPGPGSHQDDKWVAHYSSEGPVWEDALFSYEVTGHFAAKAE